jgi:hypothetical protein
LLCLQSKGGGHPERFERFFIFFHFFFLPLLLRFLQEKSNWKGLYFGGVAFKHQDAVHPDQDKESWTRPEECKKLLQQAVKEAAKLCDCVITSGHATGVRPSLLKIRTCHEALQGPLGKTIRI